METEADETPQRRFNFTLLAFGAFAVVAASILAYVYWCRTPQYSVAQIKRALATHDVALFEKHVDIETVSTRLIDDIMSESSSKQSQEDRSSWGAGLAAGLIQLMKPRLAQVVREQVTRLVETGSFTEDGKTDDNPSDLNALSKGIGAKRDSFRGVGYVRKEGKVAMVGLNFYNADLDTTLALEITMRNEGSYWRMVELTNLSKLTRTAEELRPARLAAINAPIQARMQGLIVISGGALDSQRDAQGFPMRVDVRVKLHNASKQSVSSFVGTVCVYDQDERSVNEFPVSDTGPLAPSAEREILQQVYFQDLTQDLFYLPSEQAVFKAVFHNMSLSDGTELRIYDSLEEARLARAKP